MQDGDSAARPTDGEDRQVEAHSSGADLDIASEHFNPLRALYAANLRVSEKTPKVQYQNLAAFESALNKFGIWNLSKKNNPAADVKHKQQEEGDTKAAEARRFLPHQMPIQSTRSKLDFSKRNIFARMVMAKGPISVLNTSIDQQRRIRVALRREHGVRGSMEGLVVAFDKYWNLLLRDAIEVWKRRKYAFLQNKFCGEPQDCSMQLLEMGITLPAQNVKSIDRKHIELRRHLPQVFVRGEQIVTITILDSSSSS